jgi:Secretion system C-terminal sorting domain
LDGGASEVITIPANGSTWRLEVEQSTNHPWHIVSSASIEGCGTSGTGTVSLGIINQYPLNDEAPFSDQDCRENMGAFDPNDKQGFPLGVGTEKAILRSQSLDYLIRFQNTGTDTAFNIVVLDTLPATLDVSSIRMLSASHNYQFSILGNGILKWIFPNIMLADSNANEALSHGFLKFRAVPVANLPENTQILNRAGIYFDYNLPVLTDYSLHTIKTVLTSVSTEVFKADVSLSVFPNPTSTTAIFTIKSLRPMVGRVKFLDLNGKVVLDQAFEHNQFEVPVSQLATGTYLFQLESDGQSIANGKVVVVNE